MLEIVIQLVTIALYQAAKIGAKHLICTIKRDYVMSLTSRMDASSKLTLLGLPLVGHIGAGNVQLGRDDACVLRRCNEFSPLVAI